MKFQNILQYCQARLSKLKPKFFTHHVVYIDSVYDDNDFGIVIGFSKLGRLEAKTKFLKFSEKKNRAVSDNLQIVKRSVANKNRLVVQQIVPAPISKISKKVLAYFAAWRIEDVQLKLKIPEIIYFNKAKPAELWPDGILTHLISLAYPGLNLQNEGQAPVKTAEQPYFVGARLIFAPSNGVIRELGAIDYEDFKEKDASLVSVAWFKQVGDYVFPVYTNDQEVLGYIVARSTDYPSLVRHLEKTADRISQTVFISEYIGRVSGC